jgi:CheY-like chemotaxis protein
VTDVAAASTAINDSFRILMAEDNPINQRVGVLMLKRAGFDVDVVADGSQAVQAHREKRYQLILMDLHMPVMDGIEATRRIRKLGDGQPMIIAVTADVLAGAREKCLEAGMDGYLSKPFTSQQLVQVVANARDQVIGAESRMDGELLGTH